MAERAPSRQKSAGGSPAKPSTPLDAPRIMVEEYVVPGLNPRRNDHHGPGRRKKRGGQSNASSANPSRAVSPEERHARPQRQDPKENGSLLNLLSKNAKLHGNVVHINADVYTCVTQKIIEEEEVKSCCYSWYS